VSEWLFTRLDWLIAWRHLRTGDELPVFVRPLLVGALYLIAVGGALAWYASTLDPGVQPIVEGPFEVPGTDLGPTPLQRYYGAFGGLTLVLGIMALTFALLSWFFNLLPTIITMSVLLGCMALVVVLSLMSGLEGDLRDKILAQKAHVRVARHDGRPFEDYGTLTEALSQAPGVAGAAPYLEGEIMLKSGLNRQGAILSGIIPDQQAAVSNLPSLIRQGEYAWLQKPELIPDPDPFALDDEEDTPWRLRHLEKQRKADEKRSRSFEGQKSKDDDGLDLPPMPPIPSLQEEDGEDSEGEPVDLEADEGGWEDPVQELERRGKLPELPAPGEDASADEDEGAQERARTPDEETGPRLRLPPPPEPEPEPEPDAADDGWEDPAAEVERLRAAGELPTKPDPPGTPDAEPDAPEPDDTEPDDTETDDDDDEPILDPVLIGRELSMELGVRVGAEVQLVTPVGRMTPAGRIPGVLGAKIAGVFFSGMYEYDRKNVYAPLPIVQRFLRAGDRVTGIEVKLVDVERIDEGKAAVIDVVERLGRSEELLVEDWRDLNRNLFSAMFLEKVAMFIALLFVVLVASFGILASNLMSVMEKSKEIAILKAMGTPDSGILRVFVAEGLCVGILGSFGGIGMGLALCWALDRFGLPLNENVYYIEKLPVVVNPLEVALVGVAALVIVCFSSLYPALVASRLRPVDGLRQADQ
jgi:ABC-type lipoprotein release transport system permease subunit